MSIPFTQYIRPDGRPMKVEAPASPELEALAQKFIERGGWFECEILTTGHVSLTGCLNVDDEPQDVEIEVAPNGPEVDEALEKLVRRCAERVL